MRLPVFLLLFAVCCGAPAPETVPDVAKVAPAPPAKPSEPPVVVEPKVMESQVVVSIPKLAGQDKAGAAKILGEPDSCETVNPSGAQKAPKCSYWGGNVEIVFFHGKADWITVYGSLSPSASHPRLSGRVDPQALKQLDLPVVDGTHGPIGMFYKGQLPGVVALNLFGASVSDATLTYAYVKVKTP